MMDHAANRLLGGFLQLSGNQETPTSSLRVSSFVYIPEELLLSPVTFNADVLGLNNVDYVFKLRNVS